MVPPPPANAIVTDACVATKWHLKDEDDVDKATLLLTHFAQGQVEIVAPDHIRYEVPAAITRATRGRTPRITPRQGPEAIEEFLALALRTFDPGQLAIPAYLLVHQYGCSFYDALYLALAQKFSLHLITADAGFYQTIRHLPLAVWLGDYVGP